MELVCRGGRHYFVNGDGDIWAHKGDAMSNKPEDDKAKAARGAPNIQPTFPPPIRPLEALKPATEPPESPLVLQMPMWLGTGELVNTSGFKCIRTSPPMRLRSR